MKKAVKQLPKTRDLEKTREKILYTAFQKFFQSGFQATSMDDIVKETDLSKGAFYHQFPTKFILGYAVVEEVIRPLIIDRWIRPLQDYEDPLQGILDLMQKHICDIKPDLIRYGCPLNNFMQEMSPVDKGFHTRLKSALQLWIQELEKELVRAKENGLILENINTQEAASFIVMFHEGVYGFLKGSGDRKLSGHFLNMMKNYLQSISTGK
ncbi:TetR/AcrR family transcriptional regulator [Leptospira selangorensis]|uniref:TetR/AcrR family transcriptional regulator n=1 Tax=Leptospira selangorensis TaxID=2484982 RepID=A0A5F2BWE2_9LEPT|nr:TetR/AcrR family transcriptional regulator [Leptospira selangorensis]TGM13205.1 TetR/AcrR family transcriptional regulator [Leptospira selangorensis]TGM15328.1 TetR/AcrR family transcriptional regulator [Leptospira selangorensis]